MKTEAAVSSINYISLLYQNDPQAEVVGVQLINSATGKSAYRERYSPTGQYMMVPSFSKVPEVALQYLNWLATPENDFVIRYGFEGEHYRLIDGLPVAIDTEYNSKTRINPGDLAIVYNGDPNFERDLAGRTAEAPPRVGPLYKDYVNIGLENSWVYYSFLKPIESETKYASNLNAKRDEIMVQSIMARPENFDTVFDRLIAEYLAIGGQEIIDEKTRVYQESR
jgi:putative aldouronate transport system substrate-binding protein